MVRPHRLCCAALAAGLALAAFGTDAGATTLVLADGTVGPQPYQSWIDSAHVPTPAGEVLLRLDGCPGTDLAACESRSERTLDIDLDWLSPRVLLHELGHVFDDGMPAWARTQFAAIIHRTDPWDGPVNPPSEQFAEAYSLCARYPRLRRRHFATYGYAPTPAQHRRACALITRAGA